VFCRHCTKHVFCRHFLHKTCCVLHVFSLQNILCSAGTLSQNMYSTGTFSTKHVVSCTSFLYKTCFVLEALYLKTCILQALSPQNTLCPARLFSTKHVFCRLSISKMCSTGTFSTKHVVSCTSFLYKICYVLQALYLKTCVLQALSPQNMLCPARLFSTKYVVFCRHSISKHVFYRHFLHKTCCALHVFSLQNMCSGGSLSQKCVLQALSLQNMLCPAGLFSPKHVVFRRHYIYKTCVLQALSSQNMLCPAGLFSTTHFVFCRHSLYKTSCVPQALGHTTDTPSCICASTEEMCMSQCEHKLSTSQAPHCVDQNNYTCLQNGERFRVGEKNIYNFSAYYTCTQLCCLSRLIRK